MTDTVTLTELATEDIVANPVDSAPRVWKALAGKLPPLDATTTALADFVREAGRSAVPGPIAETLLVARPLLATGFVVPDGPLTYAAGGLRVRYAHPDADSRVGPFGAAGTDRTLRVSGVLARVPWARTAAEVVVLTRAPLGPVLLRLDPARAVLQPGVNIAGEPRDTLVLNDIEIPSDRVRPIDAEVLAEARTRAALARAALMAGAAQRCVELTVRHTTTRHQFGRALRDFQAVKQEEAKLIEETALVSAAVAAAATALDNDGAAAQFAAAVAKAQASESAAEITRIGHQLHGAIGFTELTPLRLATMRLWSWRDEDGDETEWARYLGERALRAGADGFWSLITTPGGGVTLS
ncbi:acyl-CoA dehydrogenase family protein [Nocardia sp. NEAU-G5]|uniref:Acyl-CoA dehydrogenase family protein n=1 Tax=Nocardia albiluteola TaxID=2842303 RepID=A0ABS6B8C2_9NOCA|nr:acyl-CoA dehydrogenase family protein [Nocardia albiluteola]MBU3066558.1 acyl-CoA dehydrogenase family protein [Nocardia albiluteola]